MYEVQFEAGVQTFYQEKKGNVTINMNEKHLSSEANG